MEYTQCGKIILEAQGSSESFIFMAQNMNQANISLLPQWRAQGNTGDLPVGWQGGGGPSSGGSGSQAYPGTDISSLVSGINKQETDLFNKFQEAVQPFQTDINKTQGLLDTLEGNINARTRGTLTSEAQRKRMLVSESQPLNTQLTQLGRAEAGVAQPYTAQMQLFNDIAGRQITGFTADNQSKLDWYSKQAALGQEMSLEQMREANALLLQENQYKSIGKYGIVNALGKYISPLSEGGGGGAINPDKPASGGAWSITGL